MSKRSKLKQAALGAALIGGLSYLARILNARKPVQSKIESQAQADADEPTSLEDKLEMLHAELSELLSAAAEEIKSFADDHRESLGVVVEAAERAKAKLEPLLDAVRAGINQDELAEQTIKETKKALADAKKLLLKAGL